MEGLGFLIRLIVSALFAFCAYVATIWFWEWSRYNAGFLRLALRAVSIFVVVFYLVILPLIWR